MKMSSSTLSSKIKTFEQKYIAHYIDDAGRLDDCQATLSEVALRQKAIDEIESKVLLYKECVDILADGPTGSPRDLTCFEDFKRLHAVHQKTLRLWKTLSSWRVQRATLYDTPIRKLDFAQLGLITEEAMLMLQKEASSDAGKPLYEKALQELKEGVLALEVYGPLKQKFFQRRHWLQLWSVLGKGPFQDNLTITDMRRTGMLTNVCSDEMERILKQADAEYRTDQTVKRITGIVDTIELKLIPYRSSKDMKILSEFCSVASFLEDESVAVEQVIKSCTAVSVKEEAEELLKVMIIMQRNMDKWAELQKYWISLEPVFRNDFLQKSMRGDTKTFTEITRSFHRIVTQAAVHPNAKFNLYIACRADTFERLINTLTVVQKSVEDMIESRRLAFPRFFFMTDA